VARNLDGSSAVEICRRLALHRSLGAVPSLLTPGQSLAAPGVRVTLRLPRLLLLAVESLPPPLLVALPLLQTLPSARLQAVRHSLGGVCVHSQGSLAEHVAFVLVSAINGALR
jgi:hypothetical protein